MSTHTSDQLLRDFVAAAAVIAVATLVGLVVTLI
jgi:type III secretory pathway component EscS